MNKEFRKQALGLIRMLMNDQEDVRKRILEIAEKLARMDDKFRELGHCNCFDIAEIINELHALAQGNDQDL